MAEIVLQQCFKLSKKNTQEQNRQENQFFTVAFELQKTLSKQGTVSRGIAFHEKEKLTKIEEHHQIEKKLSGEIKNNHRTFEPTSAVSMNFWGFTPFILHQIFGRILPNARVFLHNLSPSNKL